MNRDGGQVAEVTVIDAEGGEDAAAIGARTDTEATVLRGLASNGGADGVLGALHAEGLLPNDARALRLFDRGHAPRRRGELRCRARGHGGRRGARRPGGRGRPGLRRRSWSRCGARPPRTREEVELPPPLAEPRLDFRVDLATAAAYEVEAGEYIQIIDVQGKQCSDFLAFNRDKLERGIERGLDATTTRTLMGTAYPEARALLARASTSTWTRWYEVVQDTVGRHDSFALACTREVLRGPRLSRARQLLRRTSTASSTPYGGRSRARAGRRSTSSTTRASTTDNRSS